MYMDGVPLTLVCETDWSHGGDKILIKKDTDLSEIKGKTIGVYLNMPSVTFFLNQYLANSSGDTPSFRFIKAIILTISFSLP